MTENASEAEPDGGIYVIKAGIAKYDDRNYQYIAWQFMIEAGFFTSRSAALDHADSLEKELNARPYERYLQTTQHKVTEHAEKVRVREEQNRVLSEAGLPTLGRVADLHLFSSDVNLPDPLPYNEWINRQSPTKVWQTEVIRVEEHAPVPLEVESKPVSEWDLMIARARGEHV